VKLHFLRPRAAAGTRQAFVRAIVQHCTLITIIIAISIEVSYGPGNAPSPIPYYQITLIDADQDDTDFGPIFRSDLFSARWKKLAGGRTITKDPDQLEQAGAQKN
jgi:hypothetical protein